MREIIEINGQKFSIIHLTSNDLYIVSKWDWEEFKVPYSRAAFKTKKGALKRIIERANN